MKNSVKLFLKVISIILGIFLILGSIGGYLSGDYTSASIVLFIGIVFLFVPVRKWIINLCLGLINVFKKLSFKKNFKSIIMFWVFSFLLIIVLLINALTKSSGSSKSSIYPKYNYKNIKRSKAVRKSWMGGYTISKSLNGGIVKRRRHRRF